MRIALFSECYLPVTNGVVTSIQTLRKALQAWGHQVLVFAPGTEQPGDDEDIFRLPELPFPRHPYHFARPFPKLKVDFTDLGIDVIHCQHPFTVGKLGSDTARRAGLPMVYTAHSLYDVMASTAKSPIVRTMGQKAAVGVIRKFCCRADYIIAPSRHTMDELAADGVNGRFVVIPSGVVPSTIRPDARQEVRAALNLNPETPLLLYVGRLAPEKRLDLLLYAIAILRQRRLTEVAAGFRLALVGDGQSRSELEILCSELGIRDCVHFVGSQPHDSIGDWYAAGDIFTLTAPFETQGLVVLEAMSAGLPCVVVNYGGPKEIVVHGETGFLTDFNALAFAGSLETLLNDPVLSHEMGVRGQERALNYSPEIMASSVMNVYEKAIALPRQPREEFDLSLATAELLGRRLKKGSRRTRMNRSPRSR